MKKWLKDVPWWYVLLFFVLALGDAGFKVWGMHTQGIALSGPLIGSTICSCLMALSIALLTAETVERLRKRDEARNEQTNEERTRDGINVQVAQSGEQDSSTAETGESRKGSCKTRHQSVYVRIINKEDTRG